jgi:penicillin-binding protein 1A
VDVSGIVRAAIANMRAGGRAQGASTITMQLARNFFLTRERSYVRKIYEILLTWKIEQALTKDQILEIYANQIFPRPALLWLRRGRRTYFGKRLDQLSVAQMAMLAGLPKAPARDNPIVNPKRAKERQLYVLSRMHALGIWTTSRTRRQKTRTSGCCPNDARCRCAPTGHPRWRGS